jgi:hypothetical protein
VPSHLSVCSDPNNKAHREQKRGSESPVTKPISAGKWIFLSDNPKAMILE